MKIDKTNILEQAKQITIALKESGASSSDCMMAALHAAIIFRLKDAEAALTNEQIAEIHYAMQDVVTRAMGITTDETTKP